MILVVLGVFGLVFGSFVNALVWRLHQKRDFLRERSECTHCHHVLAAKDLIPVVSWLMLRGRCRYCHKKIDDTPVVELATALLFLGSYVAWPYAMHGEGLFRFILWLVFLIGFMALIDYDIRWYLLPNKIVYPYIGLATLQVIILATVFHGGIHQVLGSAIGALLISGVFWVLFQMSSGKWIGGGDVKLGVILGFLAGGAIDSLLLLFIASLAGTLAALPLLLMGKAKRRMQLPFGPFLIIGMIAVQLFGAAIITWYTNHLLSV
jgi:prepilin signal peptidase PulO-like enzyme (type II secretory pathway)